jgi:putative transposase
VPSLCLGLMVEIRERQAIWRAKGQPLRQALACGGIEIRSGPVATGIAAKGAPAGPGNAATTPGVPRCARPAGRHTQPPAGCLDSPSGKTTALGGERGDDKGQNVTGRQRHRLVETLGLLRAVLGTAAAGADPAGARRLLARLGGACQKLRWLGGDGGDRGQLVAWGRQQRRCVLRVTLRPAGTQSSGLLPRRRVGDRTRAWLNQAGRLRNDYERLPTSSEAIIDLSMTRLMWRRLAAA